MSEAAEKAQRVAAIWKRAKRYDWHSDTLNTPGNVTIIFRDPRAAKATREALAIILERPQLIHNGGKP